MLKDEISQIRCLQKKKEYLEAAYKRMKEEPIGIDDEPNKQAILIVIKDINRMMSELLFKVNNYEED